MMMCNVSANGISFRSLEPSKMSSLINPEDSMYNNKVSCLTDYERLNESALSSASVRLTS